MKLWFTLATWIYYEGEKAIYLWLFDYAYSPPQFLFDQRHGTENADYNTIVTDIEIWYWLKYGQSSVVIYFFHSYIFHSERFMCSVYPLPSRLLHWHWGNHAITPVPVNQPWRMWAKFDIAEPKHNSMWSMCIIPGMCIHSSGPRDTANTEEYTNTYKEYSSDSKLAKYTLWLILMHELCLH